MPIALAFSPTLLATASVSDNTIRLWDAKTGVLVRAFADITRHASDAGLGPTTLAFSPDGSVLYTNSDTSALTVWDPLTGSLDGSLTQGLTGGTATGRTVLGIAVSSDGRTRVAVTDDGTVLRWHTNANWHTSPSESVTGLAIAPDGTTATAGDANGVLTTWNLRTGADTGGATTLDSATYGIRYTRDGTRITGSVDATFTVTTSRGGMARSRSIHLDGREFRGAMAVSPDGTLFAAAHERPVDPDRSSDYRVGVWDVATLTERADLDPGDRSPVDLEFSPDGDRLSALTNEDGAAMLSWRVPGFSADNPLSLGADALTSAVFTPDGRSILTAGTGGVIQIRDAATGAVRDHFGQHSSAMRALALSHDGRTVATITTDDPVVRLWDLRDRRLLAVLTGHESPVNVLAFAPDDRLLVTGGTDTDVGVWVLDPAEAVRRVCDNLADAGERALSSVGC